MGRAYYDLPRYPDCSEQLNLKSACTVCLVLPSSDCGEAEVQ